MTSVISTMACTRASLTIASNWGSRDNMPHRFCQSGTIYMSKHTTAPGTGTSHALISHVTSPDPLTASKTRAGIGKSIWTSGGRFIRDGRSYSTRGRAVRVSPSSSYVLRQECTGAHIVIWYVWVAIQHVRWFVQPSGVDIASFHNGNSHMHPAHHH